MILLILPVRKMMMMILPILNKNQPRNKLQQPYKYKYRQEKEILNIVLLRLYKVHVLHFVLNFIFVPLFFYFQSSVSM